MKLIQITASNTIDYSDQENPYRMYWQEDNEYIAYIQLTNINHIKQLYTQEKNEIDVCEIVLNNATHQVKGTLQEIAERLERAAQKDNIEVMW